METPRALWRAFLPPILYWWPFYVTPTFLGLTKSSTVAPHWCIPSHVMPRRLLIRGAQPLIPCTPLSRYRRYKSPCRAIFCLLRLLLIDHLGALSCSCCNRSTSRDLSPDHHLPCWDQLASCTWALQLPRDSTASLLSTSYCRDKPREPTCITRSSGGSTPVSTYQTDHYNSSSQSLRTHLADCVYRATTLCAHSKTLAPTTCPEKIIPPNSPDVYVTPKSHARTCLLT